jgi:hypothetical protein
MTDPLRVLDDGSASPALRSLLESAKRADDPRAGQIDALSARLAPLMVPLVPIVPPPVPVPTAIAGAGHAALAVKIAAAIAAVGLAGGGAWYVHASHAPAPVVAPPIVVVPSQPVAPAPPPMPPPEPAPTPAHRSAPRTTDAAAESALVTAAEDALVHGDPATALARAREHATRFPSGAHAEERDRIAIEALVRLGNSDTAHAAAEHFFTRYPHSIYRGRLETLLR